MWREIKLLVLTIFIQQPLLALIPAILFLIMGRFSRARVASVVGYAWAIYGLYEYGMKLRILCSGECNIRVDLLLIYPVLLAGSLVALVLAMRKHRMSGADDARRRQA